MAESTSSAQENAGDASLLPGLGHPLNYEPTIELADRYPSAVSTLFPNALDEDALEDEKIALPLLTCRELVMIGYMDTITDKEGWDNKVFDEGIQANWKAEMLESTAGLSAAASELKGISGLTGDEDGNEGEGEDDDDNNNNEDEDEDDFEYEDYDYDEEPVTITESMVNWVLAEVKTKVDDFRNNGYLPIYPGCVVKSDTAIPAELREALKAAARVLEEVPEREKDWHPGSDGKVLDLIHPSLYPLVYGKSRVIKDGTTAIQDCIKRCGEGEVIAVPPESDASLASWSEYSVVLRKQAGKPVNVYSRKFQWLPSDISLDDNGVVKITSYINNLHPGRHADLYQIIGKVIARAIPLWNATLTPLLPANKEMRQYQRITYTTCVYDPDPENNPQGDEPKQAEGEDEEDYDERLEEWYRQTRQVVQLEPGEFAPPPQPKEVVDLVRDFKDKGLQVVVKMANIELTPEKPTYEGGSWHVEGQLNEHICASAIYYYDSYNITESRLAFRQQASRESYQGVSYPQDHHDWLEAVFGCGRHGRSVQVIGAPLTPEGRLLTWPNILQHQVQPFELQDKTQRGWRKILALFLVDPHIRVISTANVPVQRKDWWMDDVKEGVKNTRERANLGSLPVEVQDRIFDFVDDFPLGMEDAKELRVELMEERMMWQSGVDKAFSMHKFSLCEH